MAQFKPNPYMLNEQKQKGQTEIKSSVMMWLMVIALYVLAGVFYYASATNAYSFPFSILFDYSVGSLALALAAFLTGIAINAEKHKSVVNPAMLCAASLILTPIIFFIWTCFWPNWAHSYRMYYGMRIPEIVDLGGWITAGRVLATLSVICGIIVLYIDSTVNNHEHE